MYQVADFVADLTERQQYILADNVAQFKQILAALDFDGGVGVTLNANKGIIQNVTKAQRTDYGQG